MNKLFGEYYAPIVFTIWIVSVQMIAKGEYGFVPGLCAAIMAAGIAFLLIGATKAKSDKTKLVALVGSVIVIVSFMVLIVEREVPIEPSEQTTQAE